MVNPIQNAAERGINRYLNKNGYVFLLLWLVLFILYIPAAKAGFIEDYLGWVYNVTTMPFWDYVNRTESHIASLYQFTQIITYFIYKVVGNSNWGWHIIHLSLQAANGYMLFVIFKHLLLDSRIKNAAIISLGGVLFYLVCPHISEVIVWEPAYHYLQGFLLILLTLRCAQKFITTGNIKYVLWASVIFALSTFSLEIFYLTPWFVFTLAIYYRLGLNYDKSILRKVLLYFTLPQMIMFTMHILLLQHVYDVPFAHIGNAAVQTPLSYLRKPPKYFFNILLFGRYFPEIKTKVYDILDTLKAVTVFYSLLSLLCLYIVFRFRKMTQKGKVASLFFVWTMISMALITPLWWQDFFLICYDRYTYVLDAFLYICITVLLSMITLKYVPVILWSVYAIINTYYTEKANWYWKKSAAMMQHLLDTFPNDPNKTVLCLNLPECLDGAPMIGAQPEGGLKIMYNMFMPKQINNEVYDMMCYNMIKPKDGAHVTVVNDSTIKITLNQWGTWWQYQHIGGHNYETPDFKLNMTDMGHEYEVVLKKPAHNYLILYIAGEEWHIVDWNKKNVEQH